jgi:Lipase (class 3)
VYDDWQVTFYLSNLSGILSQVLVTKPLDWILPHDQAIAAAQAAAQADLNRQFVTQLSAKLGDPVVQKHIGDDWKIVWGPSTVVELYKKPDWLLHLATFTATNSAYVVRSQSQNRYVLAIAGTNFDSVFDLLAEDLFIVPGVTWESALQTWGKSGKPVEPSSTDVPNLTSGTFIGISSVLGLRDPNTQATLQSFLQTLNLGVNETLTVTGHSLGGALSPTLALALIDPQGPLSSLPASQVRTYPTAGPTPGNTAFAARYFEHLPASIGQQPWQTWNANLWNTYDLVPRAWGIDTLYALPGLYALSLEYGIGDLAQLTAKTTLAGQISELFAAKAGLPGRLNTLSVPGNFVTSPLPIDCFFYQYQPLWPFEEYLTKPQAKARGIPDSALHPIPLEQQIGCQHIEAYAQFITPDLAPAMMAMAKQVPAHAVRRMAAA